LQEGTARSTLTIDSPELLPSGTVVQAVVTETFNLTSGEVASEETRTEDLILYRVGGALTATFPIVPSRTFAVAERAARRISTSLRGARRCGARRSLDSARDRAAASRYR
jgi:hypothetical protein